MAVSVYTDALRLLARRELSAAECRERLLARDHPQAAVEDTIRRLVEEGALDDRRVARAHARTAVHVKGRGRSRVARELHARGVDRDVVAEALAEVFGEIDERSLVARAIERKLRGRPRPPGAGELARLYQFLMRQGFSPTVAAAAVRELRGRAGGEET